VTVRNRHGRDITGVPVVDPLNRPGFLEAPFFGKDGVMPAPRVAPSEDRGVQAADSRRGPTAMFTGNEDVETT
jgi:hypothetical protein